MKQLMRTSLSCHTVTKFQNYNFKALTYFSFCFFFLVVGKVILYKTAKN